MPTRHKVRGDEHNANSAERASGAVPTKPANGRQPQRGWCVRPAKRVVANCAPSFVRRLGRGGVVPLAHLGDRKILTISCFRVRGPPGLLRFSIAPRRGMAGAYTATAKREVFAMRTLSKSSLVAVGGLLTILGAAHCGAVSATPTDGGPAPDGPAPGAACTPPIPTAHRPAATSCSTTRPPGLNEPGAPDAGLSGGCTSDSQCTTGTNPRCTPSGHRGFPSCTSDACATDSQCGTGKVCECGADDNTGRNPGGRDANKCLPSNCQTDTDCGPGGFCSPSFDTSCGPYDGFVGYFCHRPADQCTKDECTNDAECNDGGTGYCAWEPTVSKWVCAHSHCSG